MHCLPNRESAGLLRASCDVQSAQKPDTSTPASEETAVGSRRRVRVEGGKRKGKRGPEQLWVSCKR